MNITINDSQKNEVITKPTFTPLDIKENPIKKRKIPKFVFWILFLLLVLVAGFATYRGLEFSNNVGIKIQPNDIFNPIKKDPELKKDSTGKMTSALIVGIDSRSAKSGLLNTDSMIIATYHYDSKKVTMVSVPRDLYVKIPNEGWYTKINAFYSHGEGIKKGSGLNYLKSTLQNLTGIEIQYYAMVDLQGFKKIVDAVGGVTINVENTFTDYTYPVERKNKPVYETITFKKGVQTMDGERALKYARSRHSSDNGEGTDFARAKRQQKVIAALKDKVLSSSTLLNPQKVLEIMGAIQDNIKLSQITNEDIQAGINIAKGQQNEPGKSYSFVLQPSFGNYQILWTKVPNTNAYAIAPIAGMDNYTAVKRLIRLCLEKSEIYDENPKIKVYDVGMGSEAAKAKVNKLKKTYPYLDIVYMGKLFSNKTGIVVYGHESKYSDSVTELASYLSTKIVTKPDYIKTNLNNENVTILLGKAEVVKTETETQP